MPQIQVLQREPDTRQEQVLSAIEKASAAVDRKRQIDLYGLQIQQSIKNASDEKEKMKFEETKAFNDYFIKLLERTDPETAFQVASKTYPNSAMKWADGFGEHKEMFDKIGKTAQEKVRESNAAFLDTMTPGRANLVNAQADATRQDSDTSRMQAETQRARLDAYAQQLDIMRQRATTDEERLALDKEMMAVNEETARADALLKTTQANMLNGVVGNAIMGDDSGDIGASNPRSQMLLSGATVGGFRFDNPVVAGQMEAAKTEARNEADLRTRPLSSEEKANLQAGREVIKVISRLQGMTMPKDIVAQAAASTGKPFISGAFGKGARMYGSQISKLKALIPFARGGKALTGTEAVRVDTLLNPTGKSEAQQSQDLNDFMNEFIFGSELITKGVKAALRDEFLGSGEAQPASRAATMPVAPSSARSRYTIQEL